MNEIKKKSGELSKVISKLCANDPQPINDSSINSMSDFVQATHIQDFEEIFSLMETDEQREAIIRDVQASIE